jgi:endogenous inhibitor of DNA gyrase (YacG/DUF329 family)
MAAFVDVRCGKCGKRYGWHGSAQDDPGCPKCQQTVDLEVRYPEPELVRAALKSMPKSGKTFSPSERLFLEKMSRKRVYTNQQALNVLRLLNPD